VRPIAREEGAQASNQQWYHDPVRPLDERGVLFSAELDQDVTTENDMATTDLPKAYRPQEFEGALYERWLAADVFAPDRRGSRADWSLPPYVITMPPPNITGALHLGHAARATVEDVLIRHARMQRRPTLWLPGVDHASIAAQLVLDGILAGEGETRDSLGRERYLERMWRFINATRDVMGRQQRRLGASADWSRLRFTMDEGSSLAVRTAFKRLYDADLAYRTEALINWCPGCRTTLSDLEVIATPTKGTLWFVRYHYLRDDGTPDPNAWITVATTRPETILGDVAVAVHPEDERYREAIGREVLIPFVDRRVPVIADEAVERGFGTGAVKVTPGHDQTDYEIGRRHGLPLINVMDDAAAINENGGPYLGLDRFAARERILADLEARGDLAESRAHEMVIGRCQRSDDVVEPRLKTSWFIRTGPMAAKVLATVRAGRTRFIPKRFEKVFFHWMENIHDWNVSRQLWWGHRIPAWYCPDGHVTVSDKEGGPDSCATCGRPASELSQEVDIFDTWFSSGLWPFSTLGWPDTDNDDYRRFYPTTVMETAYDIIFFWVARMMMLGEQLTGQTPFEVVYLAGLVRDPYGRKMSKTIGNVIDPLGTIDEIGADAMRFALVDGVTPGNDQRLGTEKLDGARNFANKLWNAARFVLGARPAELDANAPLALPSAELLGPAEHWILARLAERTRDVSEAFEEFRLGEATRGLHEAIWSEYCDWYLEIAKVRLSSGSTEERIATWRTLAFVLDRYLRLLHPVMPFVTEAIWQRLPRAEGDPELLIVADWPQPDASPAAADPALGADDGAVRGAEELFELIRSVRNVRAESGIEPGAWLEGHVAFGPAGRAAYSALAEPFARLARLRPVHVHADRTELAAASGTGGLVAIAGDSEARLARGGADLARERQRLERELARVRGLLDAARARLADERFTSRAPRPVVDAARARADELERQAALLEQRVRDAGGGA
jgi:valyl-tRNA synthetase